MHSWSVLISRCCCWFHVCQQLCGTASHEADATRGARACQHVAIGVGCFVAENWQRREALVGGHLPVLDTTSSGRKRRTASKGAYDLQHSWQVDWTTAGYQRRVINSGNGFGSCIWVFFLRLFQCMLEWHLCLSSCFVWVTVLCMMLRNV